MRTAICNGAVPRQSCISTLLVRLFVVLSLWIITVDARAQTVSLPLTAEKGDAFTVRVTKRISETKNGVTTNEGPFSFNYDGEVLDASASGLRIRWMLKSAFMPASREDNATLSASTLTLMKDIPLEFDAGPNGAPVRIPNFREILPRLMQVARELLTEEGKEPDPQVIERTEAMYTSMSPQTAASSFLPEAILIGSMQNLRLEPGEAKRSEAMQPNPFGGAPIKAVTELRLASHDPVSGFAVLTWQTTFDPQSIVESTKQLIQSMRKPGEKELPAEALEMIGKIELSRNDVGRALVSVRDGWVRKLHYQQKITNALMSNTQSKDETWLIEIDRVKR